MKIASRYMVLLVCVILSCASVQKNELLVTKCVDMEKEIKMLMDSCRDCQSDEECYLDPEWEVVCPFGGYFIRSRSCDGGGMLSDIKEKIDQYKNNCEMCMYEYMLPPNAEEVGCRKNKCIDLRY